MEERSFKTYDFLNISPKKDSNKDKKADIGGNENLINELIYMLKCRKGFISKKEMIK